jgi:hypothetical protein
VCAGVAAAQVAKPAAPGPKAATPPPATAAKPVAKTSTADTAKKAAADTSKKEESLKTAPLKPMELTGVTNDGLLATINYNLPYSGMVELRVLSPEGKQIFTEQYIGKIGDNRIRLRTAPLKPGRHTFYLWYKGKETQGFLDVGGEGPPADSTKK